MESDTFIFYFHSFQVFSNQFVSLHVLGITKSADKNKRKKIIHFVKLNHELDSLSFVSSKNSQKVFFSLSRFFFHTEIEWQIAANRRYSYSIDFISYSLFLRFFFVQTYIPFHFCIFDSSSLQNEKKKVKEKSSKKKKRKEEKRTDWEWEQWNVLVIFCCFCRRGRVGISFI